MSKGSRLSLADKMLVLHEHKSGAKPVDIQLKFKISPRTYYRISGSKGELRDRDNSRESTESKGKLHTEYPDLESRGRNNIIRSRKSSARIKNLIQ